MQGESKEEKKKDRNVGPLSPLAELKG
jgi:hypothetical protein